MKTPLPDFPSKEGTLKELISALWNYNVNQHEYLAELTEVVEKLNERADKRDELSGYSTKPTPTLKETLLGEIKKKGGIVGVDEESEGILIVKYKDVEAIINRLIK